MKIQIEGKEYRVTSLVMMRLLEFIEKKSLEIYNSSPAPIQAAFMLIVRHELANLEKKHPDKKEMLRPPKRKDPVEHVLGLIRAGIIALSAEQVVEAKINANNEIITLEFGENPGQTGGSLVTGGDVRQW